MITDQELTLLDMLLDKLVNSTNELSEQVDPGSFNGTYLYYLRKEAKGFIESVGDFTAIAEEITESDHG